MEEIEQDKLEPGKLYYIESLTYDYNYEFPNRPKIIDKTYPKVMGIFFKLEETTTNGYKLAFFKNFKKINEEVSNGYDVHLNDLWKFYEVKKYKIQEYMETRACNLIIANVINDEYFKMEFL
jgi:hypothetical protein